MNMKEWSPDHPKAKLMGGKRADILAAAKTAFLQTGFGGTSMDNIAKSAGVSIMTLYRHARSKDDLFSAVIMNACDSGSEAEQAEFAEIMSLPLADCLARSSLFMQKTLTRPDTTALLRVVIAEATRFPHLAELAYQGFIVRLENATAHMLSELPETRALSDAEHATLGRQFVDRIVGADMLRCLLGLPEPSEDELRQRAEAARDDLLLSLAN